MVETLSPILSEVMNKKPVAESKFKDDPLFEIFKKAHIV
jgi:hypothetical protein